MELTTDQILNVKQFAMQAAIQIASLNSTGSEITGNPNVVELDKKLEEDFLKRWSTGMQYFRPSFISSNERVDCDNRIRTVLKNAGFIYQFITDTPKTGREEY